MTQLLIGTSNKGKVMEIEEALHELSCEIVTPASCGIFESPAEHGDTFEANALEKARFYFEKTRIATLADDSGIIVEALVNELGIHTRRWGAGPSASDEEWITYFLERMRHEQNKRAHFICVLAFIDASGAEHLFEGRCSGTITEMLEAAYLPGLPISACFKPDDAGAVFSALSIEQKNRTSHRGKAMKCFVDFMKIQRQKSQSHS